MTTNRKHLSIIAVLVLTGCGGGVDGPSPETTGSATAPEETAPAAPAAAPVEEGAGITARALLDQAVAEARKWQADAELVGVTTSLAEGPAHDFWFYDFQSPSKSTCTRIRVLARGGVANTGPGDECILMKPVSAGFVDSPAAWESARAAGFQPGESVQFGLRFQRDEALPAPRECWVLWSDADGDEAQGIIRGWCVDPVTGEFVTRLSGKGRTEPKQ